jgi:hypothetical protein
VSTAPGSPWAFVSREQKATGAAPNPIQFRFTSATEENDPSPVEVRIMHMDPSGLVGIMTDEPSAVLDVNSDIIRLRTAKTPASAGASGNAGDICWDSNYLYIAVGTNAWKRAALSTW